MTLPGLISLCLNGWTVHGLQRLEQAQGNMESCTDMNNQDMQEQRNMNAWYPHR